MKLLNVYSIYDNKNHYITSNTSQFTSKLIIRKMKEKKNHHSHLIINYELKFISHPNMSESIPEPPRTPRIAFIPRRTTALQGGRRHPMRRRKGLFSRFVLDSLFSLQQIIQSTKHDINKPSQIIKTHDPKKKKKHWFHVKITWFGQLSQ